MVLAYLFGYVTRILCVCNYIINRCQANISWWPNGWFDSAIDVLPNILQQKYGGINVSRNATVRQIYSNKMRRRPMACGKNITRPIYIGNIPPPNKLATTNIWTDVYQKNATNTRPDQIKLVGWLIHLENLLPPSKSLQQNIICSHQAIPSNKILSDTMEINAAK